MQHYRFCVARRRPDGTLDTPVREEIVQLPYTGDTILAAMRTPIDMIGSGTNAIYLTAPKGDVIWSLCLRGVGLEHAAER
jgi:hypothetical protein